MQVVALVFIVSQEGLLLVEQDYAPRYWSLPGGTVEADETIEQAAIREVAEETGLDVLLSRVVGIYLKPDQNGLAITFAGEAVGGELAASAEIRACKYFPFDGFPSHVRDHFWQRVKDFLQGGSEIVFREQ